MVDANCTLVRVHSFLSEILAVHCALASTSLISHVSDTYNTAILVANHQVAELKVKLEKKKRLEAALRANLKRRKAQQRGRDAAEEPADPE